jgi:hypothetical protein
MKKLLAAVALFAATLLPSSAQTVIARGGVNYGGLVVLEKRGAGAPTDACTGLVRYTQTDDTTGNPLWQCSTTGHMVHIIGGTNFLSLGGGTMGGALLLFEDPTQPSEAATKRYVDTINDSQLALSGGHMTGELDLYRDPVNPSEAATKNYVDNLIASFGNFSSPITAPSFSATGTGGFELLANGGCVIPTAPSSGYAFYCDPSTGDFARIDSSGNKKVYGSGNGSGGGGGTTSTTIAETTGDIGSFNFDSGTSGLTATGTPGTDSTGAFTSPNAATFTTIGSYYSLSTPSPNSIFFRAYMKLNSLGTGTPRIIDLYNSGGGEIFNFYLSVGNQYLTAQNFGTNTGTSCATASWPVGSWHYFEFNIVFSPTAGSFQAKVDGTTTCNVTGVNTGSTVPTQLRFGQMGSPTAAYSLEYDNVDVASSTVGWMGPVTIVSSVATSQGGFFAIPAGSTSASVANANVAAGTHITVTQDASAASQLGVTCNTTAILGQITARNAGAGLTYTLATAPTTNPACFGYILY